MMLYLDYQMNETSRQELARFLDGGLDPGTLGQYRAADKLWTEFRNPQGLLLAKGLYMVGLSRSEILEQVYRFLRWMVDVKGIPAQTAAAHLTGVRHFFRVNLGDFQAFDTEQVMLARKCCRAKRTREELRVAAAAKVEIAPVVPEQMDWMRARYWARIQATVEDKMAYMAIAMSQNIILRIGEVAYEGPYGPEKKTDHRFFFSDLVLEDDRGRGYGLVAYKAVTPRPKIVYFRLDTLSSKSSRRQADGKPYHFTPGETAREAQFFNDFLEWIERSQVVQADRPLFCYRSNGVYHDLLGKKFRNVLKTMAVAFGMNPRCYSGKSTRKGGASSMQVSGRPDSHIVGLTGHAAITTTVVHYIRDAGLLGNTFRNSDDTAVKVHHLKRSIRTASLVSSDPQATSEPSNKRARNQ